MDALEPRVLLNADTLVVQLASLSQDAQPHDILVRMVQETATAGAKAQVVQQVQVIDESNHGAVLAVGDLSKISAVSIEAQSGASTVTYDLDSFGSSSAPSLSVHGDGMTALAIGHKAGVVGWQVNGDGSGSAAGDGAAVSFSGVSKVIGGGGDVLHGPAPNTTWHVSGPGSGDLADTAGGPVTTFQGFTALDGAANNDDDFLIQPAAPWREASTAAPAATTRSATTEAATRASSRRRRARNRGRSRPTASRRRTRTWSR